MGSVQNPEHGLKNSDDSKRSQAWFKMFLALTHIFFFTLDASSPPPTHILPAALGTFLLHSHTYFFTLEAFFPPHTHILPATLETSSPALTHILLFALQTSCLPHPHINPRKILCLHSLTDPYARDIFFCTYTHTSCYAGIILSCTYTKRKKCFVLKKFCPVKPNGMLQWVFKNPGFSRCNSNMT